ncbi:MAG TPA: hypothetical protein EYM50_03465 [Nitrososphaerales archaeon]|nr:hypothetical protein [Nitrososphaerales archaeon]
MNIYVQDGQKYIYITKDELEELEWDEYRLLELFEEDSMSRGVSIPLAPGWLIGPSNVAASKFRYGKENLGKS